MELSNFLAEIASFNFVEFGNDKNTLIAHKDDDKISFYLRTELHGSSKGGAALPPVQVIASISVNGFHVASWGAMTEQENIKLIDCFKVQRNRVNETVFYNETAIKKTYSYLTK